MNNTCNTFSENYNESNHYDSQNLNPNFNQNFNNMGSTMMYNQVLTMTIIPLITTFFTMITTLIINNCNKILQMIKNYHDKKISNKKFVQFKLNDKNEINDEILPIIWHINKTCSIKEGDVISLKKLINEKNKIDLLLCPINDNNISKDNGNVNFQNNNQYNNGNNNNTSNNNQDSNKDNNDYTYTIINDGNENEKIFYYGINSSKLCVMSYNSDINEIGEYIINITTEYNKHKSEINESTITEKEIYIELYSKNNNNNNGYSQSQQMGEINSKVLPLIWHLNKKKIINKGLLICNNNKDLSGSGANPPSISMFQPSNSTYPSSSSNIQKNDISGITIIPFIENDESNEQSNTKDSDKEQNNTVTQSKKEKKIEIDKHIFCQFVFRKIQTDPYRSFGADAKKEYIVISSEKYSINEISAYLDYINCLYINHMENNNTNKYLYSYISTSNGGSSSNKFTKISLDKTQTFEHLFFKEKNEILNDIKNFSNIEYYKKFGMKRKLGYLFLGPPGSGKTAIVTAIANELGRSLKSIPISLIKTNHEFENVYNDISFDGQTISSNDVVITFDEIDSILKTQNLTKNTSNQNDSDKNDDKNRPIIIINNDKGDDSTSGCQNKINLPVKDDELNVGILLSKIDGNECQDGNVVIATCNDVDNLDPALQRTIEINYVKLCWWK